MFGFEVMLTIFLVTVILNTATRAKLLGPLAALPVGAVIATDTLLGGPITGVCVLYVRVCAHAVCACVCVCMYV